jgi:O-antigen/teichoic acid export membrane protein
MLGTFFLYGLISRVFSAKGVGEYTLIRRALYFLQPVTMLGLTVAVPKYLPMQSDKHERAQIACVGFAIVMAFSITFAIITVYKQDFFAVLIFGDPHTQKLVLSFAALALAIGFHSYVFSYFRGTLEMKSANVLDLMNSAVLPLVAFIVCARFSVAVAVLVLAAATIICTAVSARPLWHDILVATKIKYSSDLTKVLLKYGLPRIPGDFALAGLLLGAPWLVAQNTDLAEAGRFAIAQTLLAVPGVALAALGIVMLPYVSERLAKGDIQTLKANNVILLHAILDVSLYFSFHVYIMADVIVRLWVGQALIGATFYIKILMLAVPFQVTYFVFRSVIDASTAKPVTTINMIIAFATFVIFYIFLGRSSFSPAHAVVFSLMIAYLFLGVLTFIAVNYFYGLHGFIDQKTIKIIIYNLGIAISVLVIRLIYSPSDIICVSLEGIALVIYFVIIIKNRRGWATSLMRTVGLIV